MTTVALIIPFRDRGLDPRRTANLDVVLGWWYAHGYEPQIVSDDLSGSDQFNRHRAYNRAVSRNPDADVFVFTEADMLIHPDQIATAVKAAQEKPGLVVPFTQYRYLSDDMTGHVRGSYQDETPDVTASYWSLPIEDPLSLFQIRAESTMDNGKSIGAVNVVSRATLEVTGGFTEATSGNWYDDNIIAEGFAALTRSPTRHVTGPAVHMYHLPGWKGDHLSDADRLATQRNKGILTLMRADIHRGNLEDVRELMRVRS